MCLYPKLIDNPKYKPNKKNRGQPPTPLDKRVKLVPIGCGRCIECLKQKSREWQVRLNEEIKVNKGIFITFTFSNESYLELWEAVKKDGFDIYGYELDNLIATKGVRRFLERWRKKHKKSLRHWFITELGQTNTERIHIHGIIFKNINGIELSNFWKYGRISIGYRSFYKGKQLNDGSIGYVNEQTISYITKYVTKIDLKHKEYKPKILTSAGIGKNFINSPDANNIWYQGKDTKEYYRTRKGIKLSLPIYYRNYLFNEDEREQIWLNRLDKGVRYVLGKECKTDEEYFNLLNYARKENKKLGYGSNLKDWNLKRYEYQRKKLKQLNLINKYKSNGSN